MKLLFLFCFSLSFSVSLFAHAKLFKNTYVEFQIPETWKCKAFGTDWVCHHRFQEKKVEALITVTAKIAGKFDTLEQYALYLNKPKTWSNTKREKITSKKITKANKVFINKFPWIDSIHKNSEIKSYITRYVGTVCCVDSTAKLGILVVLSSHQKHYTKYSGVFVKAVNSLRVLDIEKAISKVRASQAMGGGAGMSEYLEGLYGDDEGEGLQDELDDTIFGLDKTSFGTLAAITGAALLYFIIKRRRKKSGRKRSRRR